MRALTFLFLLCSLGLQASPYVWWEAESPVRTNFPDDSQVEYAPRNIFESDMFSGGDWMCIEWAFADEKWEDEPPFLEYSIKVPADGKWDFYVRKFWKHGSFRYRFGEGEWRTVEWQTPLLDSILIRELVTSSWVKAGSLELSEGEYTVRIEQIIDPKSYRKLGKYLPACYDAFLLTQDNFFPRGKLKPSEGYALSKPGWSVWSPPVDAFEEGSALDLRELNEETAGQDGRIVARDGAFIREATEAPIRFWGVNVVSEAYELEDRQLRYFARFLAKRGVNLVRIHPTPLRPVSWDAEYEIIDDEQIAKLRRWVHILRDEGIYSAITMNMFFDLQPGRLDDFKDGYQAQLFYFDESYQRIYLDILEALFLQQTDGQPALVKEPAVAFMDVLNRNSLFAQEMAVTAEDLEGWAKPMDIAFRVFLEDKYGSVAKALEAWGLGAQAEALLEKTILPPSYEWVGASTQAQDVRAFLSQAERAFVAKVTERLRALGYDGLVGGTVFSGEGTAAYAADHIASNASTDVGMQALRWVTVMEGDDLDENPGLEHMASGAKFKHQSLLREQNPEQRLNALLQEDAAEKPQVLAEVSWLLPNQYRAESVPVAALASSQAGYDAVCFGMTNYFSWLSQLNVRHSTQSPMIAGQFPAFARLFREGQLQLDELTLESVKEQTYAQFSGDYAVGAFGFFPQDTTLSIRKGLSFNIENAYASVVVASWDGQPLVSSKRLLLQVATREQNYAAYSEGDPVATFLNMGIAPVVVKNISASLVSSEDVSAQVSALDANGGVIENLSGSEIELLPNALYYLISIE